MRKAILAPLRKYNANWIGEPTVKPLAIFIRDPRTDEIVGGLWGQSAAGWLFIDLLFVPENLRRRGLGATLVRDAENAAIKRGDIGVWLSTGSFQAPGFYERMGYTRFGTPPRLSQGVRVGLFLQTADPLTALRLPRPAILRL